MLHVNQIALRKIGGLADLRLRYGAEAIEVDDPERSKALGIQK